MRKVVIGAAALASLVVLGIGSPVAGRRSLRRSGGTTTRAMAADGLPRSLVREAYVPTGAFDLAWTSCELLWPGKTLALGLMYAAALLTAVAASPNPVAMSLTLPG